MNFRMTVAGLAFCATGFTATSVVAQSEPFIGQTSYFPYTFCPRGWSEADGKLLEISQYSALFSLLGANYGGDGRTTFGLPDFRRDGETYSEYDAGRWCVALEGVFPSRN